MTDDEFILRTIVYQRKFQENLQSLLKDFGQFLFDPDHTQYQCHELGDIEAHLMPTAAQLREWLWARALENRYVIPYKNAQTFRFGPKAENMATDRFRNQWVKISPTLVSPADPLAK